MTTIQLGKGADFSDDKMYRYLLWRRWHREKPMANIIGLNPSTANSISDDPTIRRLYTLCQNNGFGGFRMYNLFTIVSSDPKILSSHINPDDLADKYLSDILITEAVIFAWGNFKEAERRAMQVIKKFPGALCFGKNANGSPKHPLFLKSDTKLIKFNDSPLH